VKVLIVSDVHGHLEKLHTIVTRHPTVETVLSAGDQEISQSWLDQHNIQAVYGNAYQDSGQSRVQMEFNTWRVVMVHGHEHQVHRGDHGLARLMAETMADLVIHGHTHVLRLTQTEKGYLLNPGAVSHSRSVFPSSYVMIDFDERAATISFYDCLEGTLLFEPMIIRK
jgi:putative phosphoesterase